MDFKMTFNNLSTLVDVLNRANITTVHIKKSPYLDDHATEISIYVSPKTLDLMKSELKEKMRKDVESSLQNTRRVQSSNQGW